MPVISCLSIDLCTRARDLNFKYSADTSLELHYAVSWQSAVVTSNKTKCAIHTRTRIYTYQWNKINILEIPYDIRGNWDSKILYSAKRTQRIIIHLWIVKNTQFSPLFGNAIAF